VLKSEQKVNEWKCAVRYSTGVS